MGLFQADSRLEANGTGPLTLVLYHGTSWENATKIASAGFDLSRAHNGLLGRGVYVAREDKARRFAENGSWHQGQEGGLIKVHVNVRNPKYVSNSSNIGRWWDEGYDACRVDHTTASPNMEWCVLDPSQIRVLSIARVQTTSTPASAVPPPMVILEDENDDDTDSDGSDDVGNDASHHRGDSEDSERAPPYDEVTHHDERAHSPPPPSIGERLAEFGGDVERLNDYHQGLIDSDGEPTEHAAETGYERRGADYNDSESDDVDSSDGHGDRKGDGDEDHSHADGDRGGVEVDDGDDDGGHYDDGGGHDYEGGDVSGDDDEDRGHDDGGGHGDDDRGNDSGGDDDDGSHDDGGGYSDGGYSDSD